MSDYCVHENFDPIEHEYCPDCECENMIEIEVDQLRDEITRLRASLAEAERDAERYRWLRDENTKVALVIDKVTGYFEDGIHMYEYRSGIDLDTAIDAAMALEGK